MTFVTFRDRVESNENKESIVHPIEVFHIESLNTSEGINLFWKILYFRICNKIDVKWLHII